MSGTIWTADEVAELRQFYPTMGAKRMCNRFGRSHASVKLKARDLGLSFDKSLPQYRDLDLSEFDNVTDPKVAYLLGFLWADGHVNEAATISMVSFGKADYEDIKDIFTNPISWSVYEAHGDQRRCVLGSKKLNLWLTNFDYRTKSGTSADKIITHIPEPLRHYWWRGYFDGDGCISLVKGRGKLAGSVSISSTFDQDWGFYERLCQQLCVPFRCLRTVGKKMKKDGTPMKYSCVYLSSIQSRRTFLDYIYQGNQFGLSRKHHRYLNLRS